MTSENPGHAVRDSERFDTSTHDHFFQYYHEKSQSPETITRFERLVELILRAKGPAAGEVTFRIADVGGGAGTLARLFARRGHSVTCVDLSRDLLAVGKSRAEAEGLKMEFINCSATQTPIPSSSLDICVIPELLEHVVEWRECLDEAGRMVRPGGLLYLSTTNKLCPIQEEFTLPLYSWYPGFLKRRYERLAVTTRPELANYAKYPAVNWFTYYSLRKELVARGFSRFLDRLDMIEILNPGTPKALVAKLVQRLPFGRFAFQFVTDGSYLIALKAEHSGHGS
jgi:2-polyprenyl-3-methyl-5-hydroxy-6-metoxy-1,4-benzoquinol methylase